MFKNIFIEEKCEQFVETSITSIFSYYMNARKDRRWKGVEFFSLKKTCLKCK